MSGWEMSNPATLPGRADGARGLDGEQTAAAADIEDLFAGAQAEQLEQRRGRVRGDGLAAARP
jgi:hypothetical protein